MRLPVLLALALAGCGQSPPSQQPPRKAQAPLSPPQGIQISYGGCYGECPTFVVTIGADGKGMFTGTQFTKVEGEKRFAVPPERFAAIVAALEPIRPRDDSDLKERGSVTHDPMNGCEVYATDHPSRIILWTGKDGRMQALVWDTGCRAKRYVPVQPAIDAALAQLPVAPMIGNTNAAPLGSTSFTPEQ